MGAGRRRYAGLAVGVSGVVAFTLLATLVLNVSGGGGVLPLPPVPVAEAEELPRFDNCDEVAGWYRRSMLPQVTAYGIGSSYGHLEGGMGGGTVGGSTGSTGATGAGAPQADRAAPAAKAADSVGNGPTGTNVLEAGVDEPDLIKTSGRHAVGVSGSTLYVADTAGEPRLLGRLRLSGVAQELLLTADRALVLGQVYDDAATDRPDLRTSVVGFGTGSAVLTLVDLSRPDQPHVLQTQELDGRVLSARLTEDGTARVVLASTPTRIAMTYPTEPQGEPRSLAANRAAVARATVREWLPQRSVYDADGRAVDGGALVRCSEVRHPVKPAGSDTISVVTLDLGAPEPFTSQRTESVVASGELVAASPRRLYVATSQWGAWQRPVGRSSGVTTELHAFDTTVAGRTSYVGSGAVDGTLLDRSAISEHEGFLRVAVTTDGENGDPVPLAEDAVAAPAPAPAPARARSQSSVVVLAERSGRLTQVGRVDGLGPDERVRAVRWLGDVAAVVTFRQTDPLYLVDLSNPRRPVTRGELHITGYSAYLHPVGDGRLLGVGHEADRNGAVTEAQVSLFDVSDLAHPRRLDQLLLGRGWMPVEQDPRAFAYDVDSATAVMPFAPDLGSDVAAVSVRVGRTTLARGPQLSAPGLRGTVSRVVPAGSRYVAAGEGRLVVLDRGLDVLAELPLR